MNKGELIDAVATQLETTKADATKAVDAVIASIANGVRIDQKVQIAGRAWRQLGWRGARGAVARESALLKELTRERALGFQLLKGVKWPHARQES